MDMMNGHMYQHESFTSTLNADEGLEVPGGFTTKCLKELDIDQQVRYTHWGAHGCGSNFTRHVACIFGMSDITRWLMTVPQLTVNKMMPEVDFNAISCWHEYMYNQQHFNRNSYVDVDYYANLPYVEWNRLKKKGKVSLKMFDCHKHSREYLVKYKFY